MPLGAFFGGLLGGGLLSAGQSGLSFALNKELQQRQFDFQERMSSTAFQRARTDLEAAGLNPMLAFHGGRPGASTPSGAGAAVQRGEGVASTARQIRMMNAEVKRAEEVAKQEAMRTRSTSYQVAADEFKQGRAAMDYMKSISEATSAKHMERERSAEAQIREANVTTAQEIQKLWRGDYTGIAMAAKQLGMSPADFLRLFTIITPGQAGRGVLKSLKRKKPNLPEKFVR